MSALPEVMLAGISELTPLRGRMLLAIDGDLIGAMVDAMCGATAAHPFERYELRRWKRASGGRWSIWPSPPSPRPSRRS